MKEAIYETASGPIHYWISRPAADQGLALVFLPGLTADHRLFDKQILCGTPRDMGRLGPFN